MGSEYIVMFIPTEEKQELEDFKNETPKETLERFRKRMNALINDLAVLEEEKPEAFRESLKKEWIKKGIIKKSTTELDVPGYAGRITELLSKIHAKKHE